MNTKTKSGEQLKLAGIDKALKKDWIWADSVIEVIINCSNRFQTFTMDDVRDEAERIGIREPESFRAWGAVMSIVAKRGIIKQALDWPRKSTRPSNHGRPQTVWRRK